MTCSCDYDHHYWHDRDDTAVRRTDGGGGVEQFGNIISPGKVQIIISSLSLYREECHLQIT